MEPTTVNHGPQWPAVAEAINAIREHARPFLGGVALCLGLLFASGTDENILQAAIALTLIATAAALFGTNSTTHFHNTQRSEPRNYAESLTNTNRKEETL